MAYEIGDEMEFVGEGPTLWDIGDDDIDFIGYDDDDDEDFLMGEDDDDDDELAALLGARRRRRRRGRKPYRGRRRRRRVNMSARARRVAEAVKRVEGGTLLKKTTPQKSREFPVGFDSVATIAAGATATLTQRPQIIFRPERIVVPAAVAAFFQIQDVKVGKNSQLVSAGAIPAATFSETAFGVRLKMDTVQISQDLILIVVNIDVAARRFLASMIGESVE